MKPEPEKKTLSHRLVYSDRRMAVTTAEEASDDCVKAERENLRSFCRAHNLPAPKIQTVALHRSVPKNRHYISTVLIGRRKISSYPALYTTENGAELHVLKCAFENINHCPPEVEDNPSTESYEGNTANGVASEISRIPVATFGMSAETESYPISEIYRAAPEDVEMDYKVQDIYAEDFNADDITEAQLYGDLPAAATPPYQNGYQTDHSGTREAEQPEYEEVYMEDSAMEYAPQDTTMALANEMYGEVQEVAAHAEHTDRTTGQLTAGLLGISASDESTQLFTAPSAPQELSSAEQLAEYYPDQLAQYSSDQLARYPADQLAQYSADQLEQYSADQLEQYSADQLEQYSADQLEQYSSDQLEQYSSDQLAQYSEDQIAQYSEDQLAQYSEDQLAQYSEDQLAQYSADQLEQYSEDQLAEQPGGHGEQYSEEQYAQYGQAAPEQDLDPSGDPAQYYAGTPPQMMAREYSGVSQLNEPSFEQLPAGYQQNAEMTLEPDTQLTQYDGTAFDPDAHVDPTQASFYGSDDAAPQQMDPVSLAQYETKFAHSEEMYYAETSYVPGANTEQGVSYSAEVAAYQDVGSTVQESGGTVVSTDSPFYDEAIADPNAFHALELPGLYGTEVAGPQEADIAADAAYTINAGESYNGAELVRGGHATEEEALIDGMSAMTLQPEDSAAPHYPGAEGDGEVEYVTEYFRGEPLTEEIREHSSEDNVNIESAGSNLSPEEYFNITYGRDYANAFSQADCTQMHEDTITTRQLYQPAEDVDIYQLDQLPPADDAQNPIAPFPGAGYSDYAQTQDDIVPVGELYRSSPVEGIHQLEQAPPRDGEETQAPFTVYSAPNYKDVTAYVEPAQRQPEEVDAEGLDQGLPMDESDFCQVQEAQCLAPGAEASVDGTAFETYETPSAMEEYPPDDPHGCGITGSLKSRLQRALIVNIRFDAHVTLNLYGPDFAAFSAMVCKHKAEPVTKCEVGGWYAVDYEGDVSTAKRAVAQYVLEDGETYMMHFPDEDFMSAASMNSIFELENPADVCGIPPQGVTVEVMELTEKKVSPHTVEILLSQWLYAEVYVIPVDTTGSVPKVRLIRETGELLQV